MTFDLPIWVVYDHPTDFPDAFVARLWEGEAPTDQVLMSDSLDEVRTMIAAQMPGAYCLFRMDGDDPKILETWL
jgi:hypothetical protein